MGFYTTTGRCADKIPEEQEEGWQSLHRQSGEGFLEYNTSWGNKPRPRFIIKFSIDIYDDFQNEASILNEDMRADLIQSSNKIIRKEDFYKKKIIFLKALLKNRIRTKSSSTLQG